MPGGGDWSGQPGHTCDYCRRRSEDVGPRRGFDYANDVCGGCSAISSGDDGHNQEGHCRKCKRYICWKGDYQRNIAPESCFDGYCGDCVERCLFCSDHIHPKHLNKYSVPLDGAVKNIIDEVDLSIEILGEDAQDGETQYLCKTCYGKWSRHPLKGKPFPGFTEDEREGFE